MLMAEMMAAAGLKPHIYRNVVIPPSTNPVEVFDPLVERCQEFDVEGVNR
jgi:hypothetical protein